MIDILKGILNILTKKEVYGLFLIIVLSIIIYKVISKSLEKTINTGKTTYEKKKRTTIVKLFQNIIKYVIIIIAALSILSLYGFDVKGMVAGLGITATIIGLALRDTFKDIISGISITYAYCLKHRQSSCGCTQHLRWQWHCSLMCARKV